MTRNDMSVIRACRTRRSSQAGFTLLEILVVLVIVGIITTMAGSILIPGFQQRQARAALEEIQNQLSLAQDRAILSGRPYGLMLIESGYQFAVYGNDRWVLASEPGLLGAEIEGLYIEREGELWKGSDVRERSEGMNWFANRDTTVSGGILSATASSEGTLDNEAGTLAEQEIIPQIMLSPLGEPNTIGLVLRVNDTGWQLTRNVEGQVRLTKWTLPNAVNN